MVFTDPRERSGHLVAIWPPDPKTALYTPCKKSDTLRFSTENPRFVYVCPIRKMDIHCYVRLHHECIENYSILVVVSPFLGGKTRLKSQDGLIPQKNHKEPTASNWTPKITSFLIDQVTENFNEEIAIES